MVFAALFAFSCASAQDTHEDWPGWAYAFYDPLTAEDLELPPRSGEPPARTSGVDESDLTEFGLPGTSLTFTLGEANQFYGPADWYPGEHPEMPELVAKGDSERAIRACSFCHFANGQGKTENGHLAGLPANYFIAQLEAFANLDRYSSDPRKGNTYEMVRMSSLMTEEEWREVADYYASIPFRSMVRVVETELVPQVETLPTLLVVPVEGAPWVPLGNKIVEVPENPHATEALRDPRTTFVSYVPVGSVAKGEALVTSGGNGKTLQCAICHGPGLRGLADVPGIAGRTASYNMRQMWDVKQGTRVSPLMTAVVAGLSAEDMLNIVAYVATLTP